jgi:hypothetical protein
MYFIVWVTKRTKGSLTSCTWEDKYLVKADSEEESIKLIEESDLADTRRGDYTEVTIKSNHIDDYYDINVYGDGKIVQIDHYSS